MSYKKGLTIVYKKGSKALILAFVVSLTIWLLINLSKTYERVIPVKLSFKNTNKGTFVKSSDSLLKVTLEGSGFSLLSSHLTELKYEVPTESNKSIWEVNNEELESLFSKSLKVKNVSPKTVSYNVVKLLKKRVPILSQIKVKAALGYGITNYNLSLDSIFIYGDETSINNVSFIKTDSLFFENVTESIHGKISLMSLNDQINLHDKSINFKYDIERFTQGDFLVKINVKNAPEGKEITIFPKEIHVQFQGPISKFSDYKSEDFKVSVDANDINETNTLPIYVEEIPKGVIHEKVLKKSVTYLILEK